MNHQLLWLVETLAAIGLLALLSRWWVGHFQRFTSSFIHQLLLKTPQTLWGQGLQGLAYSFCLSSGQQAHRSVVSMVHAGLIPLNRSLGMTLGNSLGAPIILIFFMVMPTEVAEVSLALGLFGFIFFQNRPLPLLLLGFGALLLGVNLLLDQVSQGPEIFPFWWEEFFLYAKVSIFFTGLVLTFCFRSAFLTYLVVIPLLLAFQVSLWEGSFVLPAIFFAQAFFMALSGIKTSAITKRLVRAQVTYKLMAAIGTLSLLFLIPWANDEQWLQEMVAYLPLCFHFAIHFLLSFICALMGQNWSGLWMRNLPSKAKRGPYELEILPHAYDIPPGLALIQAQLQINKFQNIVERMMIATDDYLNHGDQADARSLAKIKNYERVTDRMRSELGAFMEWVIVQPLSKGQANKLRLAIRMTDTLEGMADSLDHLATNLTKLRMEGLMGEVIDYLPPWESLKKYFLRTMGLLRQWCMGQGNLQETKVLDQEMVDWVKDDLAPLLQKSPKYGPHAFLLYESLRSFRSRIRDMDELIAKGD